MILAIPYLYGGGIEHTTTWRVILSRIANVFAKEVLCLTELATVSSFYRLYRGSVILNLQRCYELGIVERASFKCIVELLLKMVYLRTTISEVPIDTLHVLACRQEQDERAADRLWLSALFASHPPLARCCTARGTQGAGTWRVSLVTRVAHGP